MNDDWRSRNKMTGREMMRVALAVLGLMAGCIAVIWVVSRLMR
jgi:hypothetical protein